MRYMQINGGQKLHLVYEPGEGAYTDKIIPAGHLSAPICGRRLRPDGGYRMTINLPLGNACRRCARVYVRRHTPKVGG